LANYLGLDCEQVRLQGRSGLGPEVRKDFRWQAILLVYLQQAERASEPARLEDCVGGGLRVQEMPVWLLKHFESVTKGVVSL
jgi:hypothetical protein